MLKHKLILGTANFGMNYGIANGKRLDTEIVGSILSLAREHGFWGIDTANAYGDAEHRIGRFFGRNEKTLKVITKLRERDYPSEADVEQEIAEAMDRLQVDSIDYLLIHSYETYRQYGGTILPVLRRLCAEKVIGHYGVSVYYPVEMNTIAAETKAPMCFEFPVNLFDRRFIAGTQLQNLKAAGHLFIARSVFLQGLFFLEESQWHSHFSKVRAHLVQMKALSAEAGLAWESLPLLFVLTKSVLDGVIIGVDGPDQMLRNIAAISDAHRLSFEKIVPRLETFRVDDEAITVPSNWPSACHHRQESVQA